MKSEWVDFKEIKQTVSMEMVLARYNICLRRVNASSLRGACPLPMHSSKGEQSFSVNVTKNAWACQSASCVAARAGKRGGNVLDFVAAFEGGTIRDAALQLTNWFGVSNGRASPKGERIGSENSQSAELAPEKKKEVINQSPPCAENKPLGFALTIDHFHPYPSTRDISPETAAHFGVGFFPGKGSMSGRFVIPIENGEGELVAYAGRSIDDTEPKYKFPSGFQKSLELWNLHRVLALGSTSVRVRRVIIVEGFFDAMRVHQAGFPNVAALMGSSMSTEQEKLIATNFKSVILALDGDNAGVVATSGIALRLARHCFVRIAPIPSGQQPDALSNDDLKRVLESV